MKKSILLTFLVPALMLAVSCQDKVIVHTLNVQTTVEAGQDNYYNGLTLQFGKTGSTDVIVEAVVKDGKAALAFDKDLSSLVGQNVWFGVKGMVKFFHTLEADEWSSGMIVLPDKESGSTVTDNANDWIVALYMGINKDGQEDGVPIYWATGNLISVKTSGAGESTQVAFHIATPAETLEEANAGTTEFIGASKYLKRAVPDSYAALPSGIKWDVYCFGDKTGLMLYDGTDLDKFVTDTRQMVGSTIVYDISGNKDFDIATNLGGLWRTPTGGKTGKNEFAALEDDCEEYASLKPDHETVGTSGQDVCVRYRHNVVIGGKSVCVNTLIIPSAGYRHAMMSTGRGTFIGLWSATADPTCTPVFYGNTGEEMPDIDVQPQTTAFAYSSLTKNTTWYAHPRTSSMPVRPVTE